MEKVTNVHLFRDSSDDFDIIYTFHTLIKIFETVFKFYLGRFEGKDS